MTFSFSSLIQHCAEYRAKADRFIRYRPSSPETLMRYFSELLLSTTLLFLEYRTFDARFFSLLEEADKDKKLTSIHGNVAREMEYRDRFSLALASIQWQDFRPRNLAIFGDLQNAQDYRDNLRLHVPEIYEETLRVQQHAERLQVSLTGADLTSLYVALEHLGRNHAIYLIPALQWLADSSSWDR